MFFDKFFFLEMVVDFVLRNSIISLKKGFITVKLLASSTVNSNPFPGRKRESFAALSCFWG